jgi:hypothetical protein
VSLRAKVSAIALTTAACMMLAPAALASTHGQVQVTGKQLKSALLPASDFVAGYRVIFAANSGSNLEHSGIYSLPSMSCKSFWPVVGAAKGFGETAFATDVVTAKSGTPPVSVAAGFVQTVYQFANAHTATVFLSQLSAKYRSCPSATDSDGEGGTLHWVLHSQSKQRVGSDRALQVVLRQSDSQPADLPAVIDVLWTVNGTDIYMINRQAFIATSPRPALFSLTLKLIARVSALR